MQCKARLVGPKNACGLLVVTIDNLELDKVTATLCCAMWLSVPAQWDKTIWRLYLNIFAIKNSIILNIPLKRHGSLMS